MLQSTIRPFAEQTFHHQAIALLRATAGPLLGRGLLAGRQFESVSGLQRLAAVETSHTFFAHGIFMPELSPILAEELERIAQPTAELLARELRWPTSTLAGQPPIFPGRRESPKPKADVQSFVIAIRGLIESEQLPIARQLLNAAPAYILSDPLVVKLRAILAPPVVKRVGKRDIDRGQEYEWLKTEGHKYRGWWVALEGGRLVGSARTLRELQKTLKTLALSRPPLLHRVN
jgi:hypothetical protein